MITNSRRVLLLTTALSGVLLWGYAGSAAAQSTTATAETGNWGGLYLGGTLGAGWGKSAGTVNWYDDEGDIASILSGTSSPLPVLADDAIINFPEPGQAYFGGFHAGYLSELNNLLVGIEAELVFSTAVREGTLTESGSLTTTTTSLSILMGYSTSYSTLTTGTSYNYSTSYDTYSSTSYFSSTSSFTTTTTSGVTTTIWPTYSLVPTSSLVETSSITTYSSSLAGYYTTVSEIVTSSSTGSTSVISTLTESWQSVVSGRANIDWMNTVKARMGVAMGQTMAYLSGGVAYGQVTTSLTGQLDVNGTTYDWSGSNTEQRIGLVVGAGVAQQLGGNWSARLDGTYFDLGEGSVTATADGAPASTTDVTGAYRQKVDGYLINLGLDYHF